MSDERFELFAITASGLERILASELRGIGIHPKEVVPGGVLCEATFSEMQSVNLWSRTASRVILRIARFHADSFYELERRAKRVDWSRFVRAGQPVRFRITCRKSRLYHSDAVAERLAAAVERQAGGKVLAPGRRDQEDEGEEVASEIEAQLFIVRFTQDVCTVSVDSSGALLHRRGYRRAVAKAPLRETLAAAILVGCDWDLRSPLVDPLSGSGTIGIEAALMSRGIAPGLNRRFAFETWREHDAGAWAAVIDGVRESMKAQAPGRIVVSDRDEGGVAAAVANAERAGVVDDIEFSVKPVSTADFPPGRGWVVTNPPYGLRVGKSDPLRNLYAQLGKILRMRAPGYHVALLSADRALEAQLKIALTEVARTTNGGIPVRLLVGEVS